MLKLMTKKLFDELTPEGASGLSGYEPAPDLDRASKITKNSSSNAPKSQGGGKEKIG